MGERRLSEIWIYPIKSLGGVALTTAQVLGKGLANDRRFMLVDADGNFMTQRAFPRMALFKPHLDNDTLFVQFENDTLSLPLAPAATTSRQVTVWNDTVNAQVMNDEYHRWFSERLGVRCNLVFFPEANPRPVDPAYKVHDEHVSLADAYPFLIIGQRSLDDLNARLREPLPMNRFRPNFVFTGGDPYEEDDWRHFTIGTINLVGVKPCARCVLTTVDQRTGVKGAEPLKTLAGYRTRNNKVLFGQNLVALNTGTVAVGDPIRLH